MRKDAALSWACLDIGVRYEGVSLVCQALEECPSFLMDCMLVNKLNLDLL